jgi:hypothetical protein
MLGSMRLLLVMWLALWLAPGLGEVVESAVQLATAGHTARSGADDPGDQGCEHGCGATEHHCLCCASQAIAAPPVVAVVGATPSVRGLPLASLTLASRDESAPPFRPPITLAA